MHSAGNDIVSLDLVNHQRSADNRFYSKIITPTEKELHNRPGINDTRFSVFVWLCWSVKESAFKYLKRNHTELSFSPARFAIQDLAGCDTQTNELKFFSKTTSQKKYYCGSIFANGTLLYFQSAIDEKMIATVVSKEESPESIFSFVHEIGNTTSADQSTAVRVHCLESLHTLYPERKFQIGKHPAGYPVVLDGEAELPLPLSFAHHGPYVAYTFDVRRKPVAG